MLPFRRILFPIDFSERCRGAAQQVELFTGRFDAELIALHVAEPLPGVDHTAAKERLERFLPKDFEQFSVRYVVLEGDPGTVIPQFARAENVDLIMMPTHGVGAFRRVVMGSVTAKVLQNAECPVWTGIHTENTPPVDRLHCEEIICALDTRPADFPVLLSAEQLAREFSGHLTLVHAVQMPPVQSDIVVSPAGAEFLAACIDESRQELHRMTREANSRAQICVGTGRPAHVVREAAEYRHADLVVLGRSQANGMLGRMRAEAYSIICGSPCPVLSV